MSAKEEKQLIERLDNAVGYMKWAIGRASESRWFVSVQDPNPSKDWSDTSGDLLSGCYVRTGMNEDARDHWYEIEDEFWKQVEIYLGRHVAESDRGGFTCSC